VSNSHHILVWEVSTIAISGQRLLETCEWIFGDIQAHVNFYFLQCRSRGAKLFLSGPEKTRVTTSSRVLPVAPALFSPLRAWRQSRYHASSQL
jgi:hypothetical protein